MRAWHPCETRHTLTSFIALMILPLTALQAVDAPPKQNAGNAIMLAGDWLPEDPHQIDYEKLPRVAAKHAVVSDVRDHAGTRVHQHAYLAHHDGRFWAMWSDGPGGPRRGVTPERHRNIVPGHDLPDTRKAFAGVVTAGLSPEQQVRRDWDRARGRGHLNSGQLSAIGSIWQRWNGAASLERSQVPMLHIWGDRGRPRPDRAALQIPDRPQIEIAWIREASHAVILQAPKAVAAAIAAFMAHHAEGAEDADVIVYGGTPGGLASAIAAARLGSRVVLVEPNLHVGGMTTSGLGKSDIENRAMIGGIFREFVQAQLQHYLDTGAFQICGREC